MFNACSELARDAESANFFPIPILGLRCDSDSDPSYQGVDNYFS